MVWLKNNPLPAVVLGATVALCGCSRGVPDCGDDDTVALVTHIMCRELVGEGEEYELCVDDSTVDLVTMVNHNTKVDRYSCSAQYSAPESAIENAKAKAESMGWSSERMIDMLGLRQNIRYTVSLDEREDSGFVVSVTMKADTL